jgi:hypothetical protein
VSGHTELRRAVPWLLCALSLGLGALSVWLGWRSTAQSDPVAWVGGILDVAGFVGIPVVGALLASRLPANPYGWLWCAVGLVGGLSAVGRPLVLAVDGPPWLAWVLEAWGFMGLLGLFVFVFLLFPTGRLPTHRWRWLGRAAVTGTLLLAVAAPLVPDPENPSVISPWALEGAAGRRLSAVAEAGILVMFALILAGMCALVLRFRRAGPVERRQLTWFVYAAVVIGADLVLDTLGLLPTGLVGQGLTAIGFALLPVAVGIAVLRYRLFEIDRIVSRTVSYGLLTAALIGCYLLVVALLRPLLEPLTGSSALAVAGSTLAVAAVFNPARRRLQEAVDRRFDRARFDAARAVDAFAARLRDQVDLDEVTTGLRDTVVTTVAPTRVAIWLRASSGTGRP